MAIALRFTDVDMFQGYYINLDRHAERRLRMEAELQRFGLSQFYERLSAVDGFPGATGAKAAAIGCFLSHRNAVDAGANGTGTTHILEDDAILSDRLLSFLESPECAAALAVYDLVFLSVGIRMRFVSRYLEAMARAGTGHHLMDLRGIRFGGMDSYLVASRSRERVAVLLSKEIGRGPRMAIDVFFRRVIDGGLVKAAVLVPFLTCVDIETGTESSIQDLSRDELRLRMMRRTAFFVDRHRQPSFDLQRLAREARAIADTEGA